MPHDKIIRNRLLDDIDALMPPEERWENLTLANDFMFSTVMSDPELCKEMISRILPDLDISHIEMPEAQKTVRGALESRSVRFDLYTKSEDGKIYDIEIQTTNNLDLPRRTRAYHILMGDDVLRRNRRNAARYRDIPDSYVIFICMFDPFDAGRYIYSFKNLCSEDNNIELGDGAFTIFLNAKGTTGRINAKLQAFLDFLKGGKDTPDDDFIRALSRRMSFEKLDIERRRLYMYNWLYDSSKWEDAKDKGREEGLALGIAQGRTEGVVQGVSQGERKASAAWIEKLKSIGLAEDVIANLAASVHQELQAQI